MTETELRQLFVNTAKSYYGCNENDGSHRKIIDLYNSHLPLARSYKVTYTDAWCATYVSAMAIKCGLTDIVPTECGCEEMINLFKKLGRWQENEAIIPMIGDIVFYDWQDNGTGDNYGVADHVGIVCKVVNGSIKVLEGNISNSVGYRTIMVNARYIRGYGRPNYGVKCESVMGPVPIQDADEGDVCEVKLNVLKRGSKGNSVKALQMLLIGNGFPCGSYGADGSFGGATLVAVKAYQKTKGLDVDGSVGPATWGSLLR